MDVSFVFRLTNYLFYIAGNMALAAIAAGPKFNSERDDMVLEGTSGFLDRASVLKARMKMGKTFTRIHIGMPKRTSRGSVRTKRPVTASKISTENSTRSRTDAYNPRAGNDSKSERGAEMTL